MYVDSWCKILHLTWKRTNLMYSWYSMFDFLNLTQGYEEIKTKIHIK